MAYPIQTARPSRRSNVTAKTKYSYYKQELREDFLSRCGYCDTLDFFSGGRRGFHIDHFAPKSIFDALKNSYGNLIYCCPICNMGKSDDWPGTDPLVSFVGDIGYVDPCDPKYHDHLERDTSGKIIAKTALGSYIHRKLKLNLRRRQLCWLLERMESQLEQLRTMLKNKNYSGDPSEIEAFCKLQENYFRYLGILKVE